MALLSLTPLSPAFAENTSRVLIIGDSLSAAYGIPREQSWVALLQQQLDNQKRSYKIINSSISGETTSGGRTRLKKLLDQHRPAYVIIQLGANDGLRGLPVADLRQNLTAMIESSQLSGAKVALIGIMIPPNYGPRYTQEFSESYALLAKQFQLPLVPFLLEGVTENPELMLDDGLHPNADAQPLILDTVWKALSSWLLP